MIDAADLARCAWPAVLGPLWLVSAWPVSAWAVDRGMSLGQLATDEKSNEITAIPELIDSIEIQGAVITIDAAGCQRAIAAKIIAAKIFAAKIIQGNGDYVLALKGNQGNLHDAVIKYFETHRENNFADIHVRTHAETLKGHGRVDEITYYQMAVPGDFVNRDKWAGLKTIGVAIRQSTSGAKSTTEVRFYISSLAMGVQQLARFIRGHWAIENSLHWCLDVTFREDECRVRQRTADSGRRTAANNLAWLKRFGLSLLKQQNDKYSIAMRRRVAGWNLDYLAQVPSIPML